MPLGTLDRSPPPIFKQGASAVSKLLVFTALSIFLMVADLRLKVTQPIRAVVSAILFPLQWVALQPVRALDATGEYITSLNSALQRKSDLEKVLAEQHLRSSAVEQLKQENAQLRQLLQLQKLPSTSGIAAEIVYDAPDPYTRKVIIDKGLLAEVMTGSPVVGALGVIGQVTRVYPTYSEVTLLVDREQTIPVLNTRTGERSVAYGDHGAHGSMLELRFMAANANVQEGDLLTTSGVDGVYPAGLHVARVTKIERRADSAFAKIFCQPLALINGPRHVLVIKPVLAEIPLRNDEPASSPKKGAKKGSAS
jgi:rod shape-determining protein MreC